MTADTLIIIGLGVAALGLLLVLQHATSENDRLRRRIDGLMRTIAVYEQTAPALAAELARLRAERAELLERCGESP